MAKKENITIDESFMKEMISQGLPTKKESKSAKENKQSNIEPEPRLQPRKEKVLKANSATKINSDTTYEDHFLSKLELQDRRSVYVSYSTHEKLTRIANVLGSGKATVSSYIEFIVQHHFDTYKDDINELYRQNMNDIL